MASIDRTAYPRFKPSLSPEEIEALYEPSDEELAYDEDLGRVHFVEERASGKVSWRDRKLADVLKELRQGDTLLVSELSRLGRSMLECMEILSIATQKDIHVYAIKGNWRLDGTLQSKIVAMAFSMA